MDALIKRQTADLHTAAKKIADDKSIPVKERSVRTILALHVTAGGHEIALSSIYADELNKRVGDPITLVTSAGEKQLAVCGIYSDIINGGKTAKAAFTDTSTEPAWAWYVRSWLIFFCRRHGIITGT